MTYLQADPELYRLVQYEISHLLDDTSTDNTADEERNLNSNVYFDKQLTHLVVSEYFNFSSISQLLTPLFTTDKIETTERACRERWSFIHRNRYKMSYLKEKQLYQKRAKSVSQFSNPFSLYSVDYLIVTLEKYYKLRPKYQYSSMPEQTLGKGYDIMKDSFRKVVDKEEHYYLEMKMEYAIKKAKEEVFEEKPLFFIPKYENHSKFYIYTEELTAERVRQLMAFQIYMEKVERELVVKNEQKYEEKYESIIKKRLQKEEASRKIGYKNGVEDDWDEYESD